MAMVQLQILSKILNSQSLDIVTENMLDETYFVGYETEFNYIKDHYQQYGNVPDKATFLSKFPLEILEVTESDRYLVDKIREEQLFSKSVAVVQKVASLLKEDANVASEYLISELPNLQPNYSIGGTNIIDDAVERYEHYLDIKEHQDDWFFTTGFKELDDVIHGIQRKEELIVLFARTNQGKSWILEKMCTHVWELGFNVGYVSPEMSGLSIGYRFDTLHANFSNRNLMWGEDALGYEDYIKDLSSHKNKFVVATPIDFNRKVTVSKLKTFIKTHNLDLIAVDGIKYMTDERYKKGDTLTTSLTNISEDLISLSMELNVPVLVVVQSNRDGVVKKDKDKADVGTPELENIRDSDGIAQNATKVISIRQSDYGLEVGIKKQRFGRVGDSFLYDWDIDTGTFTNIPMIDKDSDSYISEVRETNKFKGDLEDVF